MLANKWLSSDTAQQHKTWIFTMWHERFFSEEWLALTQAPNYRTTLLSGYDSLFNIFTATIVLGSHLLHLQLRVSCVTAITGLGGPCCWDVTLKCWELGSWHFHLCSFKIRGTNFPGSQCNTSEEQNPELQCCENFKTHNEGPTALLCSKICNINMMWTSNILWTCNTGLVFCLGKRIWECRKTKQLQIPI